MCRVAHDLALCLDPGDVVLLEGPLGSGKTTFASAFLRALEIGPFLGSPTFPIVNEYRRNDGHICEALHFDLYRIHSPREFEDRGIEAYFQERNAVFLIEWASLWPDFKEWLLKAGSLGRTVIQVELKIPEPPPRINERSLTLSILS